MTARATLDRASLAQLARWSRERAKQRATSFGENKEVSFQDRYRLTGELHTFSFYTDP